MSVSVFISSLLTMLMMMMMMVIVRHMSMSMSSPRPVLASSPRLRVPRVLRVYRLLATPNSSNTVHNTVLPSHSKATQHHSKVTQ
ncbi:hypothetical protein BZA77DRAFT_307853 [Pyronema omphalodes]|nr:hypothetical protein BZA77DRAFT_307853 [Pyronema omphalodes]